MSPQAQSPDTAKPGTDPAPLPPRRDTDQPWRTEGVSQDPKGGRKGERRRFGVKELVGFVILYFLLFGVVGFFDTLGGPPVISYSEFTAQVERDNVAEVFSRGERIEGVLRQAAPRPVDDTPAETVDETYTTFVTYRPSFAQDDLLAELEKRGVIVRAEPIAEERGALGNMLISLAPWLLLIGFYYWLFKRQTSMGGVGGLFGGGNMTKPVEAEKVRVTFDDVAGIDEVEEEISDIVDYLRDPLKYRNVGARAPKGVLLSGPPGTGKTLLARATAGEAGVAFFSATASEFIEMIVGVGARRVRELFEEARKVAPAIIFIDEIDTIGRARAAQTLGGHDEQEQTLNQILAEMDGFSGDEGVVVLAATNRPDILDPALLRPGRFDRTVVLHAPDQTGRTAILTIHTRHVPLAGDVSLDALAAATPGMTGADLANLVNEAAFAAAKEGAPAVDQRHFFDALEKVQLGTARNIIIPEDERRRTAFHEAGHALLGMLQPGADPVRKVSIIPRGHALGVTLATPDGDRYGYDKEYLRGRIIGALGGRAAEELVFGTTTTGAENDLEICTAIARSMVGRWGMSDRIGPVTVLPKEGDPRMFGVSAEALNAVDAEVSRLIDECHQEALALLEGNRARLEAIAIALLEHETLDEADVYAAAGITGRTTSRDKTPQLLNRNSALVQTRNGTQSVDSEKSPKTLKEGLYNDGRSLHEAGSIPEWTNRLHVAEPPSEHTALNVYQKGDRQ
ncbi:MAG: ATP-dependent zinc metalloprotease FtsH [Acidimicrobiia bacterium]